MKYYCETIAAILQAPGPLFLKRSGAATQLTLMTAARSVLSNIVERGKQKKTKKRALWYLISQENLSGESEQHVFDLLVF